MFHHATFTDQSPDVAGGTFWILFNKFFNKMGTHHSGDTGERYIHS
jgi:hypothetical protein